MSYFPALHLFCLGSTLILPDYNDALEDNKTCQLWPFEDSDVEFGENAFFVIDEIR